MSTFLATQTQLVQEHFSIVEIDVPVVEGTCTVSGVDGFGTPLSCDQASNATKTYKFTDYALRLDESEIWKCLQKITETPTELQIGKGLARRGTASIQLIDFEGKDPNPFAPAVTQEVINQGTFFSKLDSRNILANRECRIKNYRVESDGTIDLANGAETRYFIVDSFASNSKGIWTLQLKDELSRVNIDDSVWPIERTGFLRADINASVTTFLVDPDNTYTALDTIRVGEELNKIVSVSGIGTGAASIVVGARGSDIAYTNTLSKTDVDSHTGGDEVYLCEVSDDERLDDLLERILLDIGIDAARIPKADWTAEIDLWHLTTRVNTVWLESLPTNEVLEKILTKFQIDMWFDPVAREIKISAISVWQESSGTLTEGNEIIFESISKRKNETLRVTRALVVYDKRYLARTESIENYKKASLFSRTELEASDAFGKSKVKQFEFSSLLDDDSADLLVNRWVNRYINPADYIWKTDENKRTFNTGDIVDLNTSVDVGFDGLQNTTVRGQITAIKPIYGKEGRSYSVKAATYEPVFADNSEVVITGNHSEINLYNQFAGAPAAAVTITFVFDGASLGSNGPSVPAVRAGAFPAGSKIIIILANGADLQAKGGDSGKGQGLLWDDETNTWLASIPAGDGTDGGMVYNAEGIDTDIYFSGATPSAAYPTADGSIRAPSGGDGGLDGTFTQGVESSGIAGNSGNAGSGRSIGTADPAGTIKGTDQSSNGVTGTNGTETGPWGNDGLNNNATAGLKGSGVIDSGATVVFFGEDAVRYINGSGDHP